MSVFDRIAASTRVATTIPPKKPKKQSGGNSILGFLGHSAHVVKDTAEDAVDWSQKDLKATYKKGKAVYKAVDKYGKSAQENALGNVPLTNAWDRRVKREKAQYRSAGGRLDKMPVSQLRLSPNAIATIIQEGAVTLNIPHRIAPAGERLGKVVGRLFEGTPKSVAGPGKSTTSRFRHLEEPKVQYPSGDAGYAYRVPFLVNRKTGEVLHGRVGDVHGQLYSTLAHRRIKAKGGTPDPANREEYWNEIGSMRNEWNQGWVTHPYEGKLRIELGHGEDVGEPIPPNTRGLEDMLRWVTKDFDDAHVASRLNDEIAPRANHPGWPYNPHAERQIKHEAFKEFLKTDKAFYHQGARWRDEMGDASEYLPDEVDWTKIKSGDDYLDLIGRDKPEPIGRAHGGGASGLQRLIKGMARQTQDIERAKKWWGRKIGSAYPDEETLLQAYYDNQAQIAKELAKRRKR